MTRKQTIIDALYTFASQRPGLEFGNYGDMRAYRADMRSITKDLQHARAMLRFVELRDSITAEMILDAAQSGRLTIQETDGRVTIDYCTGQYWPTEYRAAVCAVLASVIWSWWREHCMPTPTAHIVNKYGNEPKSKPLEIHAAVDLLNQLGGTSAGYICDMYRAPGSDRLVSAGDYMRSTARREFGRGIASRFFN